MLYLGMVRSPIAHAKITSIDVTQAKASPGVVAVYTGADLADDVGPMPCGWPLSPDDKVPEYQPGRGRTRSTSPARSWQWWWPGAPRLPETRRSWSTSSTRICRSSSISRPRRLGLPYVHPDFETNVSTHWVFDSAEAGTGDRCQGRDREGSPGRHRAGADLPAAAADSGVHGTAFLPGRPDR